MSAPSESDEARAREYAGGRPLGPASWDFNAQDRAVWMAEVRAWLAGLATGRAEGPTPPRYDEVFAEGTAALDAMADGSDERRTAVIKAQIDARFPPFFDFGEEWRQRVRRECFRLGEACMLAEAGLLPPTGDTSQ